jgi:hypothetical protein
MEATIGAILYGTVQRLDPGCAQLDPTLKVDIQFPFFRLDSHTSVLN